MTLGDLYDVETAIEENFRNFLIAAGFKAFSRKNASKDFQKDRPRVELRCALGGAFLHRALCIDGQERPDQWHFTLVCQIVTAPEGKPDDNILHSGMRGTLREVMSTAAQRSWNDFVNFPAHLIVEALVEIGTVPVVKPKDGLEYSTISFGAVVAIRKQAFDLVLSS